MRLTFGFIFAFAAIATAAPAQAHPHVFAAARLDVELDDDRSVDSLRHLWSFDDLFSSTVLLQFDDDMDLDLDASELRPAGETVMASLSVTNYSSWSLRWAGTWPCCRLRASRQSISQAS